MEKCHILTMLKKYSESNALRLHMPGHKGKKQRGADFLNDVFPFDITELSFSDNLADAHGVILKAERDVASILGAEKSFFLTGGSSLGVLSAVYSTKERGKKILIGRKSHKSVYNALSLLDIEPIFLYENSDSPYGFSNGELFESKDNELIGALLTSPDYFGRSLDLDKIAQALHKNGKLLLVDGAHGGHFKFFSPSSYAGNYADAWVDGIHKTAPALTQGAILNINDKSLISGAEKGLDIFSTSSPSYPIMASCEYAVKKYNSLDDVYYRKNREKALEILSMCVRNTRFKIKLSDDPLKFTIDSADIKAEKIAAVLEKKGIFFEEYCDNSLLAIIGYDFCEKDALRLSAALNYADKLKYCEKDKYCQSVEQAVFSHIPDRAEDFTIAVSKESELVPLESANGRICAENAGLFPPCFPIITAGETYDNRVIELLNAKNAFGVKDGYVRVVKNADSLNRARKQNDSGY